MCLRFRTQDRFWGVPLQCCMCGLSPEHTNQMWTEWMVASNRVFLLCFFVGFFGFAFFIFCIWLEKAVVFAFEICSFLKFRFIEPCCSFISTQSSNFCQIQITESPSGHFGGSGSWPSNLSSPGLWVQAPHSLTSFGSVSSAPSTLGMYSPSKKTPKKPIP